MVIYDCKKVISSDYLFGLHVPSAIGPNYLLVISTDYLLLYRSSPHTTLDYLQVISTDYQGNLHRLPIPISYFILLFLSYYLLIKSSLSFGFNKEGDDRSPRARSSLIEKQHKKQEVRK